MSESLVFRPGTNDEGIWRTIIANDEYRLPSAFERDDVVVDIGMHVGGFSYAALERGAGRLYGFEAEPGNFACAVENLKRFGERAQLQNKAVWRSDRAVETLRFGYSTDRTNTGGGGMFYGRKGGHVVREVAAIRFDDVMRDVTQGGTRRVRMLKIDCEGSEFPILLTSKMLHSIDAIAGEFHEFGGEFDTNPIPVEARVEGTSRFTIDELTGALRTAGFHVDVVRPLGHCMGWFYADRSPLAALLPYRLRRLLPTSWNRYRVA